MNNPHTPNLTATIQLTITEEDFETLKNIPEELDKSGIIEHIINMVVLKSTYHDSPHTIG